MGRSTAHGRRLRPPHWLLITERVVGDLLRRNGYEGGDYFGYAVAIRGTTVARRPLRLGPTGAGRRTTYTPSPTGTATRSPGRGPPGPKQTSCTIQLSGSPPRGHLRLYRGRDEPLRHRGDRFGGAPGIRQQPNRDAFEFAKQGQTWSPDPAELTAAALPRDSSVGQGSRPAGGMSSWDLLSGGG